jgi:hypothetical protein
MTTYLSYSREDLRLVAAVSAALAALDEPAVMDPPLLAGDPFWRSSVAETLRGCDRVAVVWSADAAASPWVDEEVRSFEGQVLFLSAPRQQTAVEPLARDRSRLIAERTDDLRAFEAAVADRRGHAGELLDGSVLRALPRAPGTYLAVAPVTNAQYRAFTAATGYPAPPTWDRPEHRDPSAPVTGVDWFEAAAYAAWAGGRLPSEAQWMLAASGGDPERVFALPNGDPPPVRERLGPLFADHVPKPVGSATPEGFSGMCASTWEWCSTAWGPHRVLKGGSALDSPRFCTIAARYRNSPIDRDATVGFRVGLTVND